MKRRGFLGALTGAVAAGPSIAKEAASMATMSSGIKGGGWVGMPCGEEFEAPTVAEDWVQSEIRDVQRRLRGDLTEREREEQARNKSRVWDVVTANVEALRSVSKPNKLRMFGAAEHRMHMRHGKTNLSWRLAELLKRQLGG